MKIVVAYKWAANPQDAVVAPDGTVDWSRAKPAISDYDPVAIEVGRRVAEATGGELIGLTVGGPEAASPIARKAALSRGLDRLVIVASDDLAHAEPFDTAAVLACAVEAIGDVDLVLTGEASVDVNARTTPNLLAGHLRWPVLSDVGSIQRSGAQWLVERSSAGGVQTVAADGPLVVSVATDAVIPPVPGMKDILAAGRKPSEELALETLGVRRSVGTLTTSARERRASATRSTRIIRADDADAAAAELVEALRAVGAL